MYPSFTRNTKPSTEHTHIQNDPIREVKLPGRDGTNRSKLLKASRLLKYTVNQHVLYVTSLIHGHAYFP